MISIEIDPNLKKLHTIALQMTITRESLERFWFYFQTHLNVHLMPPANYISDGEARALLIRSKAQAIVKENGDIVFLNNEDEKSHLEGCVLFNTSGSTGTPKIIVHRKESLSIIAKIQAKALDIQKEDCTAICLPTYHVGAIMSFMRAKVTDSELLVCSYKDDILLKSKVQQLSLVPSQLHQLIKNENYDFLKNIRTLLIGGAPLEESLFNKVKDLKINVVIGHGMSETLAFFSLATSYDEGRPIYKALDSYEIKQDHQEKLLIKTPSPILGIISDQGLLKKWPDPFYESSDLIKMTGDNTYYLMNRADDIIISGGENVSLKKVEIMVQLALKNDIEELKLVVSKDSRFGQITNALITGPNFKELVNNDYTLKESFKEILKKHLSFFEIPKHFYPLPPKGDRLKFSNQELLNQIDILNGNTSTQSLFFLPGFMDFGSNFEDEFPSIKSPFIECHTLEDGNLDKMVNEITIKMKSQPIIYGYSQGGRIAFHLVEKLAEKGIFAKHLFIESAYIGITNLDALKERQQNDLSLIEKISFIKRSDDYLDFLKKWYQMPLFGDYNQTEHYKENFASKKKNIELFGLRKFLNKIVKQIKNVSPSVLPAANNAIDNPTIPTTVFLGNEDRKYVELYQKHLNHNFANGSYQSEKLNILVLEGAHIVRSEPESNHKIVDMILNRILK